MVVNIRRKLTNEIEADCLEQIASAPRLRLILVDWESKYSESKSRIDREEALSENVKNEIYNLVGFFSAFQGLVLAHRCRPSLRNKWGRLRCRCCARLPRCSAFATSFTTSSSGNVPPKRRRSTPRCRRRKSIS